MAQGLYTRGVVDLLGAGDFLSGTIKIDLLQSGYTFNPDHDYYTDLTNIVATSGYGVQTLGSKTVSVDDTNNRAVVDAADPTFTSVGTGATATQAVMWRDTGSGATSPLICQWDITSTPTNGGNITLNVDSVGLFVVTV